MDLLSCHYWCVKFSLCLMHNIQSLIVVQKSILKGHFQPIKANKNQFRKKYDNPPLCTGVLFISAILMFCERLDRFDVNISDSGDVSFLFIPVVVSVRKLDYHSVTDYNCDVIHFFLDDFLYINFGVLRNFYLCWSFAPCEKWLHRGVRNVYFVSSLTVSKNGRNFLR